MVELIALASEPELRNRLRADLRWLRRNLTAGTPGFRLRDVSKKPFTDFVLH